MGLCTSKPTLSSTQSATHSPTLPSQDVAVAVTHSHSAEPHLHSANGESENPKEVDNGKRSPFFPFYSPSPGRYVFPVSPRRFFKRSFLSPSPAKHIRAALARRHGSVKPNEAAIPEAEAVAGLDKNFGFSKHFGNKYEVGDEVGRGHFGYTCVAKVKKGELKGQQVAVKVIPKAKLRF
ncbi:Protein kinase [Vigna unguiculata]|uniref:Protein kinase n=1 Tax=Vigna unguiculata TaxID=3917 RepID=A0A4D6LSI1_VIGUN|nr:Protein kinase [Vigna unguiculata]QCD91308.1 Protein kinase [Vigna unguiculata]